MVFAEIYRDNPFVLSFELFPPKTGKGMDSLIKNVRQLTDFKPNFITCTYGAGGSTRDKTLDTLAHVQALTDIPVASHLTCVNATMDGLKSYLRQAAAQGIENIVAIRGDAPEGEEQFQTTEGGLSFGNDLVKLIRSECPNVGIAVGGYPEIHPEAESSEADLQHLKEKVDCGADVIITQLFYDNDDFLRFRERCASVEIDIPIVPGVMPITNYRSLVRFSDICQADIPRWIRKHLEQYQDDPVSLKGFGDEVVTRLCERLLAGGAPGLHFYTLNQSLPTIRIWSNLGL